MRSIATAVAALALVASAAHAQGNGKGNDQGNGHGNGGDPAAGASMQGGNGGNPGNDGDNKDRGTARGPQSGGGPARAEPGNPGGNPGRGDDAAGAVSDNRGQGGGNRARGNDRGRGNDSRLVVLDERGRDRAGHEVVRVRDLAAIPARGLVVGCPPGLARKNPPCVPPGQVRSPFRGFDRPGFWGLRLDDGRYRYDDGYLVRLAPDGRIGGYVPLLGGALAIGNLWPAYYEPVALPTYYESYYGLGPYDSYRYADNVIYQVDPETAAITSVIALLTGDTFAVGQPMPAGYDVYNVPYGYRDQYYDRPDALYRYSDGYVYQVDPETRLIAAAIELLAS
jgi:hypothetical protein